MTQARNLSRLLNKDITTYMYTATAGQTVFTGSDTNSQTLTIDNQSIMVTYNGVMLEKGSEFTVAVNTVTLLAGAEVNAEVNVIVFNNASLGGYVKSTGGDIDGGVNITNGNLLVGKTTSSLAPNGTAFFTSGQSDYSSDAAYVSKFNKKGADGTILEFRKDTTTVVGSIGTTGGRPWFINGISGIRLASTAAEPANSSGNGNDNAVNLGASGARWKDLYLSGGVYLGGTGSDNKLEDYEEGTFTPTVVFGSGSSGITYSIRIGRYTKIGNTVQYYVQCSLSSKGSSTGNLSITGLPFTNTDTASPPSILTGSFTNTSDIQIYLNAGGATLNLENRNTGTQSPLTHSNVNNNSTMFIAGVYRTSQ